MSVDQQKGFKLRACLLIADGKFYDNLFIRHYSIFNIPYSINFIRYYLILHLTPQAAHFSRQSGVVSPRSARSYSRFKKALLTPASIKSQGKGSDQANARV